MENGRADEGAVYKKHSDAVWHMALPNATQLHQYFCKCGSYIHFNLKHAVDADRVMSSSSDIPQDLSGLFHGAEGS